MNERNDVKSLIELLNRINATNATDEAMWVPQPVSLHPSYYKTRFDINWYEIMFRALYPDDSGHIVEGKNAPMADFNRKNHWFDFHYMPDVYLHLKVLNALSLKGYKVWYRLFEEKRKQGLAYL